MLSDSPRCALLVPYVVRNTFVEVLDDASGGLVDEVNTPPYARRRGSSFFRSSSLPPKSGDRDGKHEMSCEALTEDGGSETAISTPAWSRASSRAGSPAPLTMAAVEDEGDESTISTQVWPPTPAAEHQPWRLTAGRSGSCNPGCVALPAPMFHCQPNQNSAPILGAPWQPVVSVAPAASNVATDTNCHVIWCDHKAFKERSVTMKEQLEVACGLSVKTHKTAENCVRLFRKKQNARGRPRCVILASWNNAPALLEYLAEPGRAVARVVVLCQEKRNFGAEAARLANSPNVARVAFSWEEAVEAVREAVAAN